MEEQVQRSVQWFTDHTLEVSCGAPGCTAHAEFSEAFRRDVAKAAKAAGWKVRRATARCPDHKW